MIRPLARGLAGGGLPTALIALVLIVILAAGTRASEDSAVGTGGEPPPVTASPEVLELLDRINAFRAARGLSTLQLEPRLMRAAERHSLDMAAHSFLRHVGSDGSEMEDRVRDAGYDYFKVAENLAGGNASAARTMRQWTGSRVHAEQMSITFATDAGIAYVRGPRGLRHYWTLILAQPDIWRDPRTAPARPAAAADD